MRQAAAGMVLVGLTTVAVYAAALMLVDQFPGADIVQPLAVSWTGAWFLGAVFGTWNLWDSTLDVRAAKRLGRSASIRAGGFWLLRSDLLQCAACLMMVSAGVLAILQWSTVDVRTALILAGGLSIVINQVWNRVDRERVTRMVSPSSEMRAMQRLATEIAADARQMGHDVADSISIPVGTLEILRVRPGTSPAEAADIDAAIGKLLTLAEHVHGLHQRIRQRDPSLRGGLPQNTEVAP